jgi:predicted nucleotidyltransferase
MNKKDKIIKKIISLAHAKYPDSEIYLYGSRARGDNKYLSDWDLLILLNAKNISFEFETKLMDEFYELELETGEVFSPLIYSKSDWSNNHSLTPLFENIQKEGIRIK